MTTHQQKELEEKIYNILYSKSKIDVVRVLYEDEWPINNLLSLFTEELEKERERVCGELKEKMLYPPYTYHEERLIYKRAINDILDIVKGEK